MYDRAVLLLKFSSQFIDDIALALEQSTERQNKVGLGSSSVGVVSGALGIAAACTILTPAGPPLLIASLLFGGSATAVQTGTEAMKYYSEPNKLADRILALHGMVGSILSTTSYIRDHTLVPYLDNAIAKDRPMAKQVQQTQKKAMTVGMRVGGNAATGMASFGASFAAQEGAVAGRFMSRAGTNLARTARFARFAGGALSAACLVLEARELNKTMEQIKQGNPCEKATALRKIKAELNKVPSTSVVDGMCQCYVKVMANDARKKKQEANQEIVAEHFENELELMEEVVSSLEAQHDTGSIGETEDANGSITATAPIAVAPPKREQQQKIDLSKSSLLERIQLYKERQAKQTSKEQAEIDLVAM
uniref:Uncharacterized protein n=1 Tax=Grammatophora oceanica TaxID=210454 RepID=A0A7S1V4T1_9STRA